MSSAKLSRIATNNSADSFWCQDKNVLNVGQTWSEDSGTLSASMRKVPINEILARRMKEAGIPTAAELSRRAAAKRHPVSETAIKAILKKDGGTQDPGIQTINSLAVALEISPLRFAAEVLGIDPDDPALKNDDWRVAHEEYKDLLPLQQKKFLEFFNSNVRFQIKHVKTLSVK